MAGNASLTRAAKDKEDEFYTQLTDIENELKHYKAYFKDKTVFCNCDDPIESNFWKYFSLNFNHLGLKKLISTHFDDTKPSYKLEIVGDINNDGKTNDLDIIKTPLKQNGDFRSTECIKIMEEADVVVTNPPFSLFREYLKLLIDHNKDFVIIGNQNNVTYKDTFALIQKDKVWLGYYSGDMNFRVPEYYKPRATRFWIDETGQKWRSFGNMCWFTNIDIQKRHDNIILYKTYNNEAYPKYDEYDAINVQKVKEIPMDFAGVMGVPLTFLNKYNPDQFELIGIDRYVDDNPHYGRRFKLNGVEKYARILIRNKHPEVI